MERYKTDVRKGTTRKIKRWKESQSQIYIKIDTPKGIEEVSQINGEEGDLAKREYWVSEQVPNPP